MSPATKKRLDLDSIWVQLGISVLLATGVVAFVAPRWIFASEADLEPTPELHVTTVRPRGMLAIEDLLCLIRPGELGIAPWMAGQFADYELRTTAERLLEGETEIVREMRIDLVREASPSDAYPAEVGMAFPDMYWLRFQGIKAFRRRPSDIYRLVNPLDLRITDRTPAVSYQEDYIPMLETRGLISADTPCELRDVGEEVLELAGGEIPCRKIEIYLTSTVPEVEDELVGTLWYSPEVPPMGVVRLQALSWSLTLQDFGMETPVAYSAGMAPLIEGVSTYRGFCHACHGETYHERIYPPH